LMMKKTATTRLAVSRILNIDCYLVVVARPGLSAGSPGGDFGELFRRPYHYQVVPGPDLQVPVRHNGHVLAFALDGEHVKTEPPVG